MKTRTLFILFILIGVSSSLIYIFQGNESVQTYIKEINQERKDKDDFMRSAIDSPFKLSNETGEPFTGLKYFPTDIKYRIQANLAPVSKRELITLSTNTGESQSYLTYAWAEFDLDNLHHRLLILEMTHADSKQVSLFLAFADRTSGNETYGAGRYVDIKKVPGAHTIVVDFNKAYNPYCAYSENFSCPFPPKENILNARIMAGEKAYK